MGDLPRSSSKPESVDAQRLCVWRRVTPACDVRWLLALQPNCWRVARVAQRAGRLCNLCRTGHHVGRTIRPPAAGALWGRQEPC